MMTIGRHFRGFFINNGVPATKQIFVFYKWNKETYVDPCSCSICMFVTNMRDMIDNSESLGQIYWCDEARKDEIATQCLPVAAISDVYLAKQTPEFASPLAATIDASRCFTILTHTHGALNLAADSAAQVSAWLFGINCLVTGSGRRIEVAPGTVAGSHERRWSVVPGDEKRPTGPVTPRSGTNNGHRASPAFSLTGELSSHRCALLMLCCLLLYDSPSANHANVIIRRQDGRRSFI